jgi:hypothetical protein
LLEAGRPPALYGVARTQQIGDRPITADKNSALPEYKCFKDIAKPLKSLAGEIRIAKKC